jgi:hypothetical protein
MKDRGMIKWAPYKSLNQQADFLSKMAYEKNKREKPLISDEEAEEINALLVAYHHEAVEVRYVRDGYFYEERGMIDKIDTIYKYIKINDIMIHFKYIVRFKSVE